MFKNYLKFIIKKSSDPIDSKKIISTNKIIINHLKYKKRDYTLYGGVNDIMETIDKINELGDSSLKITNELDALLSSKDANIQKVLEAFESIIKYLEELLKLSGEVNLQTMIDQLKTINKLIEEKIGIQKNVT
jgi:hypothetical protein